MKLGSALSCWNAASATSTLESERHVSNSTGFAPSALIGPSITSAFGAISASSRVMSSHHRVTVLWLSGLTTLALICGGYFWLTSPESRPSTGGLDGLKVSITGSGVAKA